MTRLQLSALGAALVSVLLLRAWTLWHGWPLRWHHDQGLYSVAAWRLLSGQYVTILEGGYANIPLVGHVWTAAWAWLVGTNSMAALRAPGIAGGACAVGAAGVIAWQLAGRRSVIAPCVTLLLLGVNVVFLAISSMSAYTDPVLFQAVAVAALLACERRPAWLVLCAGAGALATLAYYAGRWTPIVLVLVGCVRVAQGRLRWRVLATAGALTAALLLPHVWAATQMIWTPFGRVDMFCGVDPHIPSTHCPPLSARALFTARVLWDAPRDGSSQLGMAGVPWLTHGEFLLCAAGLLLGGVTEWMLLLWAATIIGVGGALTVDAPFYPRIVSALVPLGVLLGISAADVVRRQRFLGALCVVAVCVSAIPQHIARYQSWATVQPVHWLYIVGTDILALPPHTTLTVDFGPDAPCELPYLRSFLRERFCHTASAADARWDVTYRVLRDTNAPRSHCRLLTQPQNGMLVERCEPERSL